MMLLLSWRENKLKSILQKRMGFPEDFMGGQTPLPLSTDLEHLQNTGKSPNRLLCRGAAALEKDVRVRQDSSLDSCSGFG